MARVSAKAPFRLLRRLLLLLGIILVAAIGVMLAAYRFGTADRTEGRQRPSTEASGDDIYSGKGFDFTQTSEGQPVFRIRAERFRRDREDTSRLEEVQLVIFREDGDAYTVTSDSALYNEENQQAELEGHVILRGWRRLEISARALALRSNGQMLVSSGPVEFRHPPELEGRASSLRVDFQDDRVALGGGVHIRNIPGTESTFRLDCERLSYQRKEGLMRAVGDVFLERDRDQISAQNLMVTFVGDDLRQIDSVRARWDVSGELALEDGRGYVNRAIFSGQLLDLRTYATAEQPSASAASRPQRVELEGADDGAARLALIDESGLARIFVGRTMLAHFGPENLRLVEGEGQPIVLTEQLDLPQPHLLRRVCAERAEALFHPDGSLDRVTLSNDVELQDEELQVSGGKRASLDWTGGRMEVNGPEVLVLHRQAEIRAPHFAYAEKSGVLQASSGVRAALSEQAAGGLGATPLGKGRGPIFVEAQEAVWTASPSSFTFRGDVRAWRAQNLLLAQQLRGQQASDQMAASGGVKTIWYPEETGIAQAETPAQPIEVTADNLLYRHAENQLLYDTKVQIRQGSRLITCEELTILLSADGKAAEHMTCDRNVKLVDPATGKQITGDRADFDPVAEQIEIVGEKVRLVDGDGNQIEGKYLVYDTREGRARIRRNRPDEPPPHATPQ